MKKLFVLFFLCLSILGNTAFSQTETFLTSTYKNTMIASTNMPYRLCRPYGYDQGKKYPLVLFLHGAGERGTNNTSQLTANAGATVWAKTTNQQKNPCFVLAPQCGNDKQWVNTNWSNGSYVQNNIPISEQLSMAMALLDSLCTVYPIDQTKIYITGISMGGYGTWDAITRFPNKFAAAIPMCGAGDPTKANLIATIPIRCFHSSDDPIVPVKGTRDMVKAINALGPNNRADYYTEYTNKGHACWVAAYSEQTLIDWMFAEKSVTIDPKALCNITTLGGTVSSQYTDSPIGEGKDMIFDNLNNSKFLTFHNASWVQFATRDKTLFKLTNYSLTSGSDAPERDPKQVLLKGSVDGINWTTIDSMDNVAFTSRIQTLEFDVNPSDSYSIYKIGLKVASGTILQLSEIRLTGSNENGVSLLPNTPKNNSTFFYLNQADKVINLTFQSDQKRSWTITDMHGRIIINGFVSSTISQINIEKVETGIYFLTVKGVKNTLTGKFIKY